MKRYTKWLSVSLALIMLLTLLPGCGKNPTGNGEQLIERYFSKYVSPFMRKEYYEKIKKISYC